jgi:hypothetical protein
MTYRRFYVVIAILFILLLLLGSGLSWGAAGCDLNNPERNVARLFPANPAPETDHDFKRTLPGQKRS